MLLRATPVEAAPPRLSALPAEWAVPQLSPFVVAANPPCESVVEDECTVLCDALLKEPLETAWEALPPTLLEVPELTAAPAEAPPPTEDPWDVPRLALCCVDAPWLIAVPVALLAPKVALPPRLCD